MTRLRQRMLEDMQIRNLSPLTQRADVEHVARFARYFGRSPVLLGPEEIRTYLVYLTNEKQLAPSTIIIAVAALRFLFTVTLQKRWSVKAVIPAPKEPQRVPVVLSPAEVVQFLDSVKLPNHRTILTTCYAAGLRISEAVHLTIPAIDSQRMVLRVEQGKGQKDRDMMLSPQLLEILREWWRVSRPRPWLFPGDHPDDPITTHAVNRACPFSCSSGIGVSRRRLNICASRPTRSARRPVRWICFHDLSPLDPPLPHPPEHLAWVAQRRRWRTYSVAMARPIGPTLARCRPPSDAS